MVFFETMTKTIIVALFSIVALYAGFVIAEKSMIPIGKKIDKIIEKPLEKYTFENLRKTEFPESPIMLGRSIEEKDSYISQMFYFNARDLGGKKNKKLSGLLNVPKVEGVYPVIIMLRGFVPREIYETGIGTKRAGEVFASNHFITLAPDFLGYGESGNPSENVMEERLETYTTLLSLFSSLDNLNAGLSASYSGKIKADTERIGLWGHSNGGQIALSVLEITSKNYPTVLWAPVSKPFPYSILYYTDDIEDHGKALRKVVANFEKDYDSELYSPTNFYSSINASIEIHQGLDDDAIPSKWSDTLVSDLEKLEKDVKYFTYPNADHNLMPDGWALAVRRSLNFYREKL